MHFTHLLLPTLGLLSSVASGAPSVSTSTTKLPQWPQSSEEFRKQHPFKYPPKNHRKVHHIRSSHNEHDDVSDELLKGIKAANNGGTLLLKKGKTYVIGKKLDLTFLNDFQMQLDGKILFTNNVTFWQQPQNYFYHPFQKSITFWKWGGKNVKIFGNGIIDGNGQAWYDGFAGKEILDSSNTYLRPILFYAENATNLSVEGIRFQKSPCWTNFIVTSKNVVFDKVTIENLSDNKNLPKNTDGWDSYNVDGLTVTDAWVNIGDDCFSPKPNTTNIYVENLYCNGTHGVSMGSIGQYPGVKDYISNAVVKNVVMLNAENGARLKGWAGKDVGYGYIKNITFDGMYQNNVDWPIVLDACYFNINSTTCAQYPSRVDMQDILFKNFSGSSSGKNGRRVAKLVCSPNAVCSNIRLENINLTSPKGNPAIVVCDGIKGDIGVPCEPASTVDA